MRSTDNINEYHRLEKLSDFSDGKQTERYTIIGWTVVLDGGEVAGVVEDLLLNPASGKVRYMVLDVDDACVTMQCEKVLIPIGVAEVHPDEDIVVLHGVNYEHLERLPSYAYQQIDDEMEIAIRLVFGPAMHKEFAEPIDEGFYAHSHFDLERLYRNRKQNG